MTDKRKQQIRIKFLTCTELEKHLVPPLDEAWDSLKKGKHIMSSFFIGLAAGLSKHLSTSHVLAEISKELQNG